MTLAEAIEKVIALGIEAARKDYAKDPLKRDGAINGFEACRGKDVKALAELLDQAYQRVNQARKTRTTYWYWRCRLGEIEWVCNCVGAILMNQGLPCPFLVTARGVLTVSKILKEER